MNNDTLGHMVARFQVQAGHKPSAREIFAMSQAIKFLEAQTAEEQE